MVSSFYSLRILNLDPGERRENGSGHEIRALPERIAGNGQKGEKTAKKILKALSKCPGEVKEMESPIAPTQIRTHYTI
jgi:hypothetical protein